MISDFSLVYSTHEKANYTTIYQHNKKGVNWTDDEFPATTATLVGHGDDQGNPRYTEQM